jgi:hypothetical protein
MDFILQPWQLYFVILAGWMNRQQQEVIEYFRTENQVLKEKLGKKRILLDDDQRRRLAVKGKVLGRKRLEEVGTLFTPDTILRWHRMLVANKWDYSERRKKKPGRPPCQTRSDSWSYGWHARIPTGDTTESLAPCRISVTTSRINPWATF